MLYKPEKKKEIDTTSTVSTLYTIAETKNSSELSSIYNKTSIKGFESPEEAIEHFFLDETNSVMQARTSLDDFDVLFIFPPEISKSIYQIYEIHTDCLQKKVRNGFIKYVEFKAKDISMNPYAKCDIFDMARRVDAHIAIHDKKDAESAVMKALSVLSERCAEFTRKNTEGRNLVKIFDIKDSSIEDFIFSGQDAPIVKIGMDPDEIDEVGRRNYGKYLREEIKPLLENLASELEIELKRYKFLVNMNKRDGEIYIFHKEVV